MNFQQACYGGHDSCQYSVGWMVIGSFSDQVTHFSRLPNVQPQTFISGSDGGYLRGSKEAAS